MWTLDLGANWKKNHVHFKVWAPKHEKLFVLINESQKVEMQRNENGYFTSEISGLKTTDYYSYLFSSNEKRADPVSHFLPQGLFGPTSLLRTDDFYWEDNKWKNHDQKEAIFYECHVGTYTSQGTFEALIEKIPYFKELGINFLEIMPVTECPGRWNWGYDGASLYAVNRNYGGPLGLKKLVNACHKANIAVCLDVVYNHLGPEGNFLSDFGYYMSDFYNTPWGKGLNYDGPYSNEVRKFIIDNALHWFFEYHIDALRLDAIHGIYDFNAETILEVLSKKIKEKTAILGKKIYLFVENDRNDAKVLRSFSLGGWNFEGAWNDDFHHAVHVELTKEKSFYYEDFTGFEDIVTSLQKGYVYQGKYSSYRKKNHGNFAEDLPLNQFITFIQNHDQIGNRANGERLNQLTSYENVKLGSALNILSPTLPLLFMGEEWGEEAPFLYFVDYQDHKLMESVVEGRKKEFTTNEIIYPGEKAFLKSKLHPEKIHDKQLKLLQYYKDLINIRRKELHHKESVIIKSSINEKWISLTYEVDHIFILFVFEEAERKISLPKNLQTLIFSSEDEKYGGSKTAIWNQKKSIIEVNSPITLMFNIVKKISLD